MKFNLALPKTDWWKVAKGALIVSAAAALTYVSENMIASDFGVYGPAITAVIAVVINILRKAVNNDGGDEEPASNPDKVIGDSK